MSEQQLRELGERLGDYVRSLLTEDGEPTRISGAPRSGDAADSDGSNAQGSTPDGGGPGGPTVPLDDELGGETVDSLDDVEHSIVGSREAAATTGMRSKKYNHRGEEWWNPLSTRSGTDEFAFTVPPGRVFSHYELEPITTTFPHELRVTKAPAAGDRGRQHIDVHWKLWGGGQIAYEVRGVYHRREDAPPPLRVLVGSRGWDQLAFQLVEQRRSFSLVVVGPDATRIWNDIRRFLDTTNEVAVVDDVAVVITAIIVGGVLGTVLVAGGLLVLHTILSAAVEEGCNAKADFTKGESLAAGELSFDIACFGVN